MMLNAPIPLLMITPLAAAVICMLLSERSRLLVSFAAVLIQLLASLSLLLLLLQQGPITHPLGSWEAPLGIALRADGLAVLFVLMTSVVAGIAALYAALYLTPGPLRAHFWPLFWFMWAALNGIWLAADIFNLYVGLELLSLAAVGLVAFSGSKEALVAAIRYLLAALLGSLAYLLGVALLYGAHGTLSLSDLSQQMQPGVASSIALAAMAMGLLLKSALFPLHTWLPPAHGGAMTPVSALLSALVIKASLYILLRLWIELRIHELAPDASQLLGWMGALAIAWGGWMALRQTLLKRVVAYSTVAQIGYIMLMFPLLRADNAEASTLALQGGVLMVLSHALAKAGMFLAAGNLILCTGRPELSALAGTSQYRPLSIFGFGLAGVSLMGLPPSGGFSAKWLLLQSALASAQWWWIPVMLLGGLLSAAYVFRVFHYSFKEAENSDTFHRPGVGLEICALALSAASILLGFIATWPLHLLTLPDILPLAVLPEGSLEQSLELLQTPAYETLHGTSEQQP